MQLKARDSHGNQPYRYDALAIRPIGIHGFPEASIVTFNVSIQAPYEYDKL